MSLSFELSEEHQLVEKTVRDAMAPWQAHRAELREMTKRAEMPEELWRDFAELGLLTIAFPFLGASFAPGKYQRTCFVRGEFND